MLEDTGLIYMSFGPYSNDAAVESLASARKWGVDCPAISVGDHPIPGTTFVPWKGHTPWGENVPRRQKFHAGYVKPFLHQYSPFTYNLYLDADTEVVGDILPGFEYLKENDLCIANDRKIVENMYKFYKLGPEYDWAREERDFTTDFLGKPENQLINSGVIFFRKSRATTIFFETWYDEWLRWAQWDEQFAFLRAEFLCKSTKILRLAPYWNEHKEDREKLIWHKWGNARDLKPKPGEDPAA